MKNSQTIDQIKERFIQYGQAHVFDFFSDLLKVIKKQFVTLWSDKHLFLIKIAYFLLLFYLICSFWFVPGFAPQTPGASQKASAERKTTMPPLAANQLSNFKNVLWIKVIIVEFIIC